MRKLFKSFTNFSGIRIIIDNEGEHCIHTFICSDIELIDSWLFKEKK